MYDTKEKCRELAEKFKQLCAERGTTPYKIARHSGLSSSTVSCFLTGKTVPKIDTIMILCNQLESRSQISSMSGKWWKYMHRRKNWYCIHIVIFRRIRRKRFWNISKCWTGIRKTRDKCNILWYDVIVTGHMRRKKWRRRPEREHRKVSYDYEYYDTGFFHRSLEQ